MYDRQTGVLDLHLYEPAQTAFVASAVPFKAFAGGRGAGKTHAGAVNLLVHALMNPGPYGMYAPTYGMLHDSTLRTFRDVASGLIVDENQSRGVLWLSGGSEVMCRSVDDPEHARGPSIRGAWLDEGSMMEVDAYNVIIACLRFEGQMGWLGATFTPKGRKHWTYQVFGSGGPDVSLVTARSADNPFLPPQFVATVRRQYTARFAQQELDGLFIDMGGQYLDRNWFKVVPKDRAPRCGEMCCRYWDLAATPVTMDGDDPDWTAGAKVSYQDANWYIHDIRHVRQGPADNERLVKQTAFLDGQSVPIRMEQEPGASGKSLVDHYARHVLVGYNFMGKPPSGGKVPRAMPLAAAAERGEVFLVEGAWNAAFLDEAESFNEECAHDDLVDAVSGAFNFVSQSWIDMGAGLPEDVNITARRLQAVEDEMRAAIAAMTPEERAAAAQEELVDAKT